jgi:membrane protease YdiL (CAAX protease family)
MLLSIPFFIMVVLVLPVMAWLSLRQSRAVSPKQVEQMSLRSITIQLVIFQGTVGGLAALAMYGAGLEISWGTEVSPFVFGVSWLTLGVFLAVALIEARRPLGPEDAIRRRLRKISAGNPDWLGVTVLAGVVEEFAYRGVLTLLLASFIGYWPGALVSAILFGLSHLSSGWRAVFMGIPFALALQYVVYISEGLLAAILVHAIYDIVVAAIGWRMHKSEEQESG